MFRNLTPEKAIAYTRIIVAISCFLPLSSGATKLQTIRYKILRFLMLLNALIFFPSLINALLVYKDPLNVSQCICILAGELQIFSNTIISIVHHDRLQKLMEIMQNSCKNAKGFENLVYQRYVDKFSTFYGVSAIWVYATGMLFILSTLFQPDPFPMKAVYPFPIDYEPLRTIIFLHQTVQLFGQTSHACVNILCAMLLLFATARFQILYMELREVTNFNQLIKCVKKYYIVKRYAKEVVSAVQFVALFDVMRSGMGAIVSGITLIQPQPFIVTVQYMFVVATALGVVFMSAYPADLLLELSQNAMQGIYESTWYEQSTITKTAVKIVLLPQEPVAIRIPCLIPTLSLDYFCSFITNVFSFFSVLRILITKDDE